MRRFLLVALSLTIAACAARTAPPLPSVLQHPDFVYPQVPAALAASPGAERIDRGWRFLQNGNVRQADREFAEARRRDPALYPAQAGSGYVALARGDASAALPFFDAALAADARYAPALVGRGQALLSLDREADALAAFEAALAADPARTALRPRIDAVRLNVVQELIAGGRTAAAAGQLAEARASLERAVALSPESGLVYRELGLVERRLGDESAALDHFRRAADLDAFDAVSRVQLGEILAARGDYAGAEAAYRAANTIEPTPELARRIADTAALARDAALPAPFRAIPAAARLTRGDLAALIGVRLADIIAAMPGQEDVLTDVRGHWATPWVTQVERAGVVEAFENHTFQPAAAVRRVDLAAAVSRLVSYLAVSRPALQTQIGRRPQIADVPPGHLNYPQVSVAVASGVLPLLPGNRFDVTAPVSGADAVEAVARLRALANAR
ncbi:MAG: tetratricopeptide repeat protein [Vicinamibacterales bacterium]